MDFNNNGIDDKKELAGWLIRELQDYIDTNNDGRISASEIVSFITKIGYGISKII